MRELQIGERVGRLPVDPDLKVEVRTEAIARAVAEPDDLRLAHRLADRDQDPLLVSVAGGEPAAVVDAGEVPIAPGRTRDADGAGGGRPDRSPGRHSDVNARVE